MSRYLRTLNCGAVLRPYSKIGFHGVLIKALGSEPCPLGSEPCPLGSELRALGLWGSEPWPLGAGLQLATEEILKKY